MPRQQLKNISGSKALIIISFLAALNPYWVIFALPVFLIGTIGMLTSKRKLSIRLLWILFPLLLWFPSMLLFLRISSTIRKANAQKIEFVIPENFRGVVAVYYPAPFGQKIERKNGREILYVPKSGIVFYSGEIEDGYTDWTYRVNGQLIEDNKAFHMEFSPTGGGSVDFSTGTNRRHQYSFRYLLVTNGNQDIQGDSLQVALEKQDSIVQRCFIEQKDLINH